MRSTSVMNDFTEINHGLDCLMEAYGSEVGTALKSALNNYFDNISSEIEANFDSWRPSIESDTFITSVSEHVASEDFYGRLSMWRAYGGDFGFALIINGGVMLRPSNALGAYSTPVDYLDRNEIFQALKTITKNIESNVDYVKSLSRNELKTIIFTVLRFAVVCTKHPAFLEEREWRIIATRGLYDQSRLVHSIETIGGIPQSILKIKLEDHPEEGLDGFALPTFLDRILIGPCEYPQVIKRTFVSLLTDAKVENPEGKVHITGVPLRANQR